MSKDSGNNFEPRHKKQRVDNDVSEHIQRIDEFHKGRMRKLKQKQCVEILEYFRTKNERKESLDRMYRLEKDLICEECGESLSKADKLRRLDEDFKVKFEGVCHEMEKYWKDMKAEHRTARTNEEELRLKKIDLVQLAINTLEDGEIFEELFHEMETIEGTSLHADSDVTKIDAPCTSIDSGNPNTSLLEQSPVVISSPVSPIQDLSPRKRLDVTNENAEKSPDNSPEEDLIALPVDHDKQINESTVPVILDEPVISGSSSVEEVTLKNDENQVSQGLIPSSVLITDSQSLKESGQSTSNGFVLIGSDDKKIYVKSVPFPADETAFPISSSIKQLDVLSIPVTPDNVNTSDCSLPLLEPSLGNQGPIYSTQSGEELVVPFETVCGDSCKESTIICLDSDDEQIHEISAATTVNELRDANNMSDEVSGISNEQPNHFSFVSSGNEVEARFLAKENQHIEARRMLGEVSSTRGGPSCEALPGGGQGSMNQDTIAKPNHSSFVSSGNEVEARFLTKENQHIEARRMLGEVSSTRGSLSCEALPGVGQGSMNQDTIVGELSHQTQRNATTEMHRLFSMAQQQCIDQSRQLPLEQLPPTLLPSSEIRVTNESLPSSSCQYVTDNHLMMHPMTRMAVGNAQTQLSDTTSSYHVNHLRNPYVTGVNSYQPSSFDPLQIELAKINQEGYAAKKSYDDMVGQLGITRDKEITQILHKYGLLFQEAENNATQKRKELELCFEKTKAHISLAKAWTQAIDEDSPIFLPSTPVQYPGMQTNALPLSSQLFNQFSDINSTNQLVRPHNLPPPYQNLLNSETGWGSCIHNPLQLQSNQHPLNFSSSGSSAGYYSHFYC